MHRLTITLPDDLYAMARAHAVAKRLSLSKAIGDLLRQGRTPVLPKPEESEASFQIDPVTQLPVVEGNTATTTTEDIQRAIDDDDARHLEMMGLSPETIEPALQE